MSNTLDERSPIKPKLDNDSDQKKKNRRGRANRSGQGSSDPSQERMHIKGQLIDLPSRN